MYTETSASGYVAIEVRPTPFAGHQPDASPAHDAALRGTGAASPPNWGSPSSGAKQPHRSPSPGQLWLRDNMQDDVNMLAEYVDTICSAQASKLQQAEREQYEAQIRQLQEQVQARGAELAQLRRLMPNGELSTQRMLAELKQFQKEAAEWKRKHHQQVEVRVVAEEALQEAIGVVDELGLECDAIHAQFERLQLLSEQEARTAAAAAAAQVAAARSWRGRWRQASWRQIAVEVGLLLLVLGGAVVATYFGAIASVAA